MQASGGREEGGCEQGGVGGVQTSKEWSGRSDEMDRKMPLSRRATDCVCVCVSCKFAKILTLDPHIANSDKHSANARVTMYVWVLIIHIRMYIPPLLRAECQRDWCVTSCP